jgi:biopolymer transport protein ExbB
MNVKDCNRRSHTSWHRIRHGAVTLLACVFGALALSATRAIPDDSPVQIPTERSASSLAADSAAGAAATKSLLEVIVAGGPLMVPILLCSFVLLVVVFERSLALRRRRVLPSPFIKRFLHQLREGELDRQQALERCEENNSYVSKVFAAGVRKWGRPAVEVEQAILDEGERTASHLRRFLRVMNGVATVGPLLGLLGTVCGMMQTFDSIATAAAMGQPELLAAGISVALVTTAAGLFVAIPALLFYLFFAGRVDQLIMEIDALGQEVVALISAEGSFDQPSARKAALKRAA